MNVTFHAVDRFRQRTGSTKPISVIKEKILSLAARGEEIDAHPSWKAKKIMEGDINQPPTYIGFGQWIIVIRGDSIVTLWESNGIKSDGRFKGRN